MASRRWLAVALVMASAVSLRASAQRVATLSVDGRSSDNVTMAADAQFVAVTWSASTTTTTDIFLATSRDGGRTFSAPVRVNSTLGDARVGGEQPPRVALVPRRSAPPEIVVVWTTKGAAGSRLLFSRSVDGGGSFSESKVVPGGEATGNRGWESVAVDSAGRVFVLWLDHRDTMAPGAMHHQEGGASPPAAKADPVEKAGRSQLYVSTLDGTAARSIARGVCYCCKTSLVAAGGGIYAVWRHVFPGNERDIAFTISRDAGRTFQEPVRVSNDHWQFDGCPENGPAIAIDQARRAHVVWLTPLDGKEDAPLVLYHAVTADGRAFSERSRIPTGGPAAHAQVTMEPNGSLLVVWDELVPGGRRVALARGRLDAGGRATFAAARAPESGDAAHPVVATTSTGAILAWVRRTEKGNTIGVARLK